MFENNRFSEMTDQEIKDQIETDARNYSDPIMDEDGLFEDAFIDGCNHQDKIATNRTVEAVIKLVNDNPGLFYQFREEVIKELENMRRV
jgi:hypothetical protein